MECFVFVEGSWIIMALIASNSTSLMAIYSVLGSQPSMSISSGKYQNTMVAVRTLVLDCTTMEMAFLRSLEAS